MTAECKLVDQLEISLRVALPIPLSKLIGTLVEEKLGYPGENLTTKSDHLRENAILLLRIKDQSANSYNGKCMTVSKELHCCKQY